VRPCPILSSPASPATIWTDSLPNWQNRSTTPGKDGCSSGAVTATGTAGPALDTGETLPLRDRLLLTLAWLRLALPHEALGLLYGVDRSTVSNAIRQIRPLLANRGFAPHRTTPAHPRRRPGLRRRRRRHRPPRRHRNPGPQTPSPPTR
jgi:Helix-turn-helix of DDE superfamily endonuclease